MKIIRILIENICDELDGAEKYARLFTQFKDTDHAISDVFARLAEMELSHVTTLHDQATKIIKENKAEETPEAMRIVWNWEHEKMIDRIARIKMLLASK